MGWALLVLTAATSSVGWYTATHATAGHHFESCRVVAGTLLVLDYSYGVGDKVTTTVEPQASAIVVSLRIDSHPGPRPAIALNGQVQFDSFGGLRGRPVVHDDGTVVPCS